MSVTFNAFEVFEMAEQIERNGVKFYRIAAEGLSDDKIKQTLLDLADMEVEHEKVFEQMRKKLSEESRDLMAFDPENEAALYVQSIAAGHVFDLKKDPCENFTGKETVCDILKIAIQAEKDSIVFYLGLKGLVPVKTGKDKVEAVIKEEMKHITLINQMLADSQ